MKICFFANGPKSGLSNNGGSRTIFKSAEVLCRQGHVVDIVATHDTFSWFKHTKPIGRVPSYSDVIVAVSARDVKDAVKSACGRPVFWWVRGKELWQMPEEMLIERARSVKCIVNATHLQEWLARHNIPSYVCYSGLDLSWYHKRVYSSIKPVIGVLKNKTHETKRWDLCLRAIKDQLYLVIDGKKNEDQVRNIYEISDVWFAPTELEGFHNVPAEANLCGCLVVCNRLPENGMGDYADDSTAMRYNTFEEALDAVRNPDYSKVEKMQKVLIEKIGGREKNMKRFAELLNG